MTFFGNNFSGVGYISVLYKNDGTYISHIYTYIWTKQFPSHSHGILRTKCIGGITMMV